jgi:hypothetical protein
MGDPEMIPMIAPEQAPIKKMKVIKKLIPTTHAPQAEAEPE